MRFILFDGHYTRGLDFEREGLMRWAGKKKRGGGGGLLPTAFIVYVTLGRTLGGGGKRAQWVMPLHDRTSHFLSVIT